MYYPMPTVVAPPVVVVKSNKDGVPEACIRQTDIRTWCGGYVGADQYHFDPAAADRTVAIYGPGSKNLALRACPKCCAAIVTQREKETSERK